MYTLHDSNEAERQRLIDEWTHSINPVQRPLMDWERAIVKLAAQQRDPAHDQPAFKDESGKLKGRRADRIIVDDPILADIPFVASSGPYTYEVGHLLPEIKWDRTTEILGSASEVPIMVSGTVTCTFVPMTLPPTWLQNLMWASHNLIAHPLSEITYWLGYLHPKIRDFGLWLHDITVPRHAPNTGRG